MGFERLERNIIEVIKEFQIKIGYENNPMSLNYPLSSLCGLAGKKCTVAEMTALMKDFSAYAEPRLGDIGISERDGIFTLVISEKGTAYVNSLISEKEFIYELINTVRCHDSKMEDVLGVFHRHSHNVLVTKMEDNGEFDYKVCFEDGVPDEFIYCLTDEGCHISYHRFTKEDFESLGL